MDIKDVFLAISVIIVLVSIVPYILDIIRGKTKPNIVTWITWTLLTGIATIAELSAGEYVTAIFTGASTLETLAVVVLGLHYGYVKYTRFDVVCQVAALVGIVVWQLFNSPALAVFATLLIDFIGALPTVRHSWMKPGEETWQTFALGSLGAFFAVLALTSFTFTSLAFPVYLTVINAVMAGIIYYRHIVLTKAVQ